MATDSEVVGYQRDGSPVAHKCIWKARRFQERRESHELPEQEKLSAPRHFSHCSHGRIRKEEKIQECGSYIPKDAVFREPEASALTYQIIIKTNVEMQGAGVRSDVVSFALLANAYGKARREEEALAVFEEMLSAGVGFAHPLVSVALSSWT